jgi:hypothetical protein
MSDNEQAKKMLEGQRFFQTLYKDIVKVDGDDLFDILHALFDNPNILIPNSFTKEQLEYCYGKKLNKKKWDKIRQHFGHYGADDVSMWMNEYLSDNMDSILED